MLRSLTIFGATVLVVGFILACTGQDESKHEPWVYSPITDMTQVAGTWEGLLIRSPRSRQDDWVKLIIRPDGTYAFESYRTIGVLHGRGQFSLKDGRLAAISQRGSISGSLYLLDASRMLKTEGTAADGVQYQAELTPKK
jgi:hypothetical protein